MGRRMDAPAEPPTPAPPLPEFTAGDLLEARAVNRRLARTPRFRVRGQWEADLVNGLILASQAAGGLRRPRDAPRPVERRVAAGGHAVRVRITPAEGRCRGAYLDIHGGAWAVGNARMNDAVNAALARAGYAVASVDYRRFGRHPLEACLADCEAAARWLLDGGGTELGAAGAPVFVGGESAGAHLAACTLLRLRDRPARRPVTAAVLFYGVYDLAGTPSLHAADRGTLVLHGPTAARNLARLTPGLDAAARRDPSLSPLHADLRALPPALLAVGDLDPLLDDTLLLHARWRDAGREATLLRAPESPHAFNRFGTRMARLTNAYVREWLGAW